MFIGSYGQLCYKKTVVNVSSGTEVPRYHGRANRCSERKQKSKRRHKYIHPRSTAHGAVLLPTASYLYRNHTVISDSPRLAKAKYGMNFAATGTVARGLVNPYREANCSLSVRTADRVTVLTPKYGS